MLSELIKKSILLPLLLVVLGFFFVSKANAAIYNASDVPTTERPSASAPLVSTQAGGSTVNQVTVVDNGSMFLSSDSAVLMSDTGQTQDIMTVASMSAQLVGPPVQKNVYFTGQIPDAHHQGTTVFAPVTATHIVDFISNNLPNGGKIVITFPTITDLASGNIASPSGTGFEFNNLTNASVICYPTTACSGGAISVSYPSITLTTAAALSGTQVYVAIGCTGTISVTNGFATCSAYKPALINPVVSSNTTCSGSPQVCNADIWKLQLQTQTSVGAVLDTARIAIGTINSVQVSATVEPTMTFSISGIASLNAWNSGGSGSTTCGLDYNNTGLDTQATSVNFGSLSNGGFSKAAQKITISTNGSYGYSLTATSSGHFISLTTGYWLPDANGGNGLSGGNDLPAPLYLGLASSIATINATNSAYFGISPCGSDVPTSIWGAQGTDAYDSKFSNPWNTGTNGYFATLANYTGGYVNGDQTHGITVIRYVASIAANTPAGYYTTTFSYVASPNF